MAKNMGFLMCLLIMAIDMVAGILGIEAEIAQNKVKHLKAGVLGCRGGPSHQAFKLGLIACVLLALAHAIGNSIWRCVCVCSKKDLDRKTANKLLAGASLILSWINMALAFTLLMVGTVSNSKSRRRSCWLAHHQPLLIGGLLCFTHGIFTVAYMESAKATRKEDRRELQQRQAERQP